MTPIFRARIENQKLIIQHKDNFRLWISGLEGSEVDIIIKKHRRRRSNRQNAYYWGVIVKLCAEYHGYTMNEMHKELKQEFIGNNLIDGDCLTTSKMNGEQFSNYIEDIKREYAVSHGVNIPDPNEVDYNELDELIK